MGRFCGRRGCFCGKHALDAASRKSLAAGDSHSITHSTVQGLKAAPQRNSLQGRWFE